MTIEIKYAGGIGGHAPPQGQKVIEEYPAGNVGGNVFPQGVVGGWRQDASGIIGKGSEGKDHDGFPRSPAAVTPQEFHYWVPGGGEALVVEGMALRPSYQSISEARADRSTIGVLTSVREDHLDVLGETGPEIARSLLNACPRNGTLATYGAYEKSVTSRLFAKGTPRGRSSISASSTIPARTN